MCVYIVDIDILYDAFLSFSDMSVCVCVCLGVSVSMYLCACRCVCTYMCVCVRKAVCEHII